VGVDSGLISGGVGAFLLAVLQRPLFLFLHLSPDVLAQAVPYYWIRVAQVPAVTLNMAVSGILQVWFYLFYVFHFI
jgi:Na+-driven multidrug efflux pump